MPLAEYGNFVQGWRVLEYYRANGGSVELDRSGVAGKGQLRVEAFRCGFWALQEPRGLCEFQRAAGHTHAGMAIEAAINAEDAGLGRLAYDALKWHASKLVPKVYGDKTEVQVVGPNGGPVQSERVIVPVNDPIEAARVYQKVMGEG